MPDESIRIVQAGYPDEFEGKIRELLNEGRWRVVATEMSVTDHHFYAILIREEAK